VQDIEEICKVYGKTFPVLAPSHFQKMMSQVVPHSSGNVVPWHNVMPLSAYQVAKETQELFLTKIMGEINIDIDYYNLVYSKTRTIFNYLKPAKIDFVKHKVHCLHQENKSHLTNWTADKYGYLPVPEYSLCESVTGRMKIKSGPNILLLPKKFRDIIVSRFGKEGSIWYLDFTSLEPRVALSVKSYISSGLLIGSVPHIKLLDLTSPEPLPKDIYSLALKTLKLSTEVSRETIKQIVLSQLYGQAKSLTIETLEKYNVRGPDEVVDMVNDFFGIDTLRQFILQGYQKTSGTFLRTFYGRHLTPEDGKPHALLNYYVQSTAVDVALLGFQKILQKLSETPGAFEVIVPIFLLHDGLILDVHKDVEHLIPKLCSLGAKDIPGFKNQIFWMSGNKL